MNLLTAVSCVVLASFCQLRSVGAQGSGQCNLSGKTPVSFSSCSQHTDHCCYADGQCYCNTTFKLISMRSRSLSDSGFFHVNATDVSHCCGSLKNIKTVLCLFFGCKVINKNEYTPTALEREKLCQRTNGVSPNDWNKQLAVIPNPLPGPCHCRMKATTCFTLKTPMTTITPKPKPTSTTATTTTSTTTPTPPATPPPPPPPSTTTAAAATTKTLTATPTTPPTTAPLTTKPRTTPTTPPTTSPTPPPPLPTTTPPKAEPLCPTPPSPHAALARMLEGVLVTDQCKWNGVIGFKQGGKLYCNGVLGFNPTKNANQIYLTDFCKGVAEITQTNTFLPSAGDSFANDVSGATALGNGISVVDPPQALLDKALCNMSACVYNPATMKDLIDFNSCFINSIGYDKQEAGGQLSSSGTVKQLQVTKQAGKCTSTAVASNTECFMADNAEARACWGDSGAPVFCQLSTTSETVLYGLLDANGNSGIGNPTADNCGTKKEFHVVPIP